MTRPLAPALLALTLLASPAPARADDAEVKAVIDRAVKALGGEAALARAGAYTHTTRHLRQPVKGQATEVAERVTVQGVDRRRFEYLDAGPVVAGAAPRAARIFNVDRGWFVSGNGSVTELAPSVVPFDRESTALDAALVNLGPLRDTSAKVEIAGEESVDGRPTVILKVSRPAGGSLTVGFDRESGLPVKGVIRWVVPGAAAETAHSTTCREFKDFDGLKVATRRLTIDEVGAVRRVSVATDVIDFKALGAVDPKTFAKPE